MTNREPIPIRRLRNRLYRIFKDINHSRQSAYAVSFSLKASPRKQTNYYKLILKTDDGHLSGINYTIFKKFIMPTFEKDLYCRPYWIDTKNGSIVIKLTMKLPHEL